MRVTLRSFIGVVFAVMVFLLVSSCGGGPPTSPSSTPTTPSDNTIKHTISVPGATVPIVVWIISSTPPKDSGVAVGQTAMIMFKVTGPSGYAAFVGKSFLSDDKIVEGDPDPCRTTGGPTIRLGPERNESHGGGVTFTADTPEITDVQWKIWVAEGANTVDFPGCPFATPKEHLGWKPIR